MMYFQHGCQRTSGWKHAAGMACKTPLLTQRICALLGNDISAWSGGEPFKSLEPPNRSSPGMSVCLLPQPHHPDTTA